MADNGRPFPHSKTRVNDQGVKTPFIIHYPKLSTSINKLSQSLISAVDITKDSVFEQQIVDLNDQFRK